MDESVTYRHKSGSDKPVPHCYSQYTVKIWKRKYVRFSYLEYKLDHEKKIDSAESDFEKLFLTEISNVCYFVGDTMKSVHQQIDFIRVGYKHLGKDGRKGLVNSKERSVEMTLRRCHLTIKDLCKFYKFNFFLIMKIAKKYEKALSKINPDYIDKKPVDYQHKLWRYHESYKIFSEQFQVLEVKIEELNRRCTETYALVYRESYPELADSELEFMKSKHANNFSPRDNFYLGIKCGLAFAIIFGVYATEASSNSSFKIYNSYGQYFYSSIGNILLYRLTWAASILIWDKHKINATSIFSLPNKFPNSEKVFTETLTILVLFGLSLFLYFQTNNPVSYFYSSSWSFVWPLSLAVLTLSYSAYQSARVILLEVSPNGLFTLPILGRCLIAPFSSPSFRDTYAANTLTSLTRVISDLLRGGCWVFSGAAFQADGATTTVSVCESRAYSRFISACLCFVLWIRFAQNLRKMYDSGWDFNPHAFNMFKYALSIAVIVFSQVEEVNPFSGSLNSLDAIYLVLAVSSALFKWWWDVRKDWGLWTWKHSIALLPSAIYPEADSEGGRKGLMPLTESKKHRNRFFLRDKLVFRSIAFYHTCVFVDLLLRFLWVISLRPYIAIQLVGPMFNIYLGSLEILRRFMWGILKVEMEHVKRYSKSHTLQVPAAMNDPDEDGTLRRAIAYRSKISSAGNIILVNADEDSGGSHAHEFDEHQDEDGGDREARGSQQVQPAPLPSTASYTYKDLEAALDDLTWGQNCY